ncbi:MAG: gamma-glutamylcyclotransferase family protein [Burkholderiaceae bacterium]|nr:gamma-glutamylcyclotransferase [Rhodoferax sp.]MCB2003736.1 gamma-glutamylcyclotransferase [Rhodoferax sp.]MCB2027215.1 gamma-glutamylcyclotransferase [Rhodoferax sp.]MCB2043352.1 gamma-glutamylcyclotransferase [Rhodoferax sp.]MCW5627915.1 gamma-glutamylcyclotransferase [Rhodoferax sp.]
MSALIFVYGTLKQGFPNFPRNSGRRMPGDFRTLQPFPLYVVQLPNEDRAPWLMHQPGRGKPVTGQVFEVDEGLLQAMDTFEEVGLPQGYVRVAIDLEAVHAPGRPIASYAYVKLEHQLAECLAIEGPFAEYTLALAAGYRLELDP